MPKKFNVANNTRENFSCVKFLLFNWTMKLFYHWIFCKLRYIHATILYHFNTIDTSDLNEVLTSVLLLNHNMYVVDGSSK